MNQAVDWKVVVHLDEGDRQTKASAELTTADTDLVGHGVARCHPSDFGIAEIGDELAAARALSDLANKLFDEAVGDIEDSTDYSSTITS